MSRAPNIYLGLGMIGIGLSLTILTHQSGRPVIFYGLILFGVFRIFRALFTD